MSTQQQLRLYLSSHPSVLFTRRSLPLCAHSLLSAIRTIINPPPQPPTYPIGHSRRSTRREREREGGGNEEREIKPMYARAFVVVASSARRQSVRPARSGRAILLSSSSTARSGCMPHQGGLHRRPYIGQMPLRSFHVAARFLGLGIRRMRMRFCFSFFCLWSFSPARIYF